MWDFFFFNDTATTEIYTLSLHDALPISGYGDVADRVQHLADLGVNAVMLNPIHEFTPRSAKIGRAHV